MARKKHTWNVIRAITHDGFAFANIETAFASGAANWTARERPRSDRHELRQQFAGTAPEEVS